MIARIEKEVPKNATPIEIEDALLYELNHGGIKKIYHRNEIELTTELDGKCGSCEYFRPVEKLCGSRCYGNCEAGHASGARTRKACKDYKKGEA